MKSASKNSLRAACASVLLASIPVPGFAQGTEGAAASGGESDLAEIVVTANRRSERLSDVGVAVAVLTGDALREMGTASTTDIAQFTPGVYVGGSMGGMSQQYTIRGVTQSDYLDSIEAPVAQYVDDVYIPFAQGQKLAIFDVSQIEVLKGPQGTLFGRNATGGLVHTIINKPDFDRVGGYFTGTYGSENESTLEGAVNLPLSSTAAVRVSGYYNKLSNWVRNVFPADDRIIPGSPRSYNTIPGNSLYEARPSYVGRDAGGQEVYGGRIQVALKPSDSLDIRVTAMGVKTKFGPAPFYTTAVQSAVVNGLPDVIEVDPSVGIAGGYQPIDPKSFEIASIYTPNSDADSKLASAQINYDFGGVTLTSVTAYQEHNKDFQVTTSGSAVDIASFKTDGKGKAFTQELRIGGKSDLMDYTAGVFYMHNNAVGTKGFSLPPGSLFGFFVGYPDSNLQLPGIARLKTNSYSVFGQVDLHFSPELTLVAGGRYITEKQKWSYDSFGVIGTDPRVFNLSGARIPGLGYPLFTDKRTEHLWAGKLQLEYRPQEGLLLYAGVNRGTKAGAYNALDFAFGANLADDQQAYGPEVLWNYEAGAKYSTGPMLLSASAFYYDYPSFQAFLYQSLTNYVINQKMKTKGFELSAQRQITTNLRASAAFSYAHSQINDFAIATGVFKDVRPPFAPRTQFSGGLDYTIPAEIAGGEITLSGDASYSSKFFIDTFNYQASEVDSHWLANFRATWKNDKGIRVTAFVRNAFNEQYPGIGFNVASLGYKVLNYNRARAYGVSVGLDF